MFKMYC